MDTKAVPARQADTRAGPAGGRECGSAVLSVKAEKAEPRRTQSTRIGGQLAFEPLVDQTLSCACGSRIAAIERDLGRAIEPGFLHMPGRLLVAPAEATDLLVTGWRLGNRWRIFT